jgi:NTE family protein
LTRIISRDGFHGDPATIGVPGFYRPRLWPALAYPPGSGHALGLYDASQLRDTLARLVDFDLLNGGATRLTVGAVDVETGNSVYFDSARQRIGPEHIMASGALPPAFPPVVIDGVAYWDGGIVSNTPLQYVLDAPREKNLLVLQVDLFSARGPMPASLPAAMQRHKDIMYSGRVRYDTDRAVAIQSERRALARLIRKVPPALCNDPLARRLASRTRSPSVHIVHLVYRQQRYEGESKDYEFSRASVLEHWCAGERDMRASYRHPDRLARASVDTGVTTYDLAGALSQHDDAHASRRGAINDRDPRSARDHASRILLRVPRRGDRLAGHVHRHRARPVAPSRGDADRTARKDQLRRGRDRPVRRAQGLAAGPVPRPLRPAARRALRRRYVKTPSAPRARRAAGVLAIAAR